eukprot:gene13563-4451_t
MGGKENCLKDEVILKGNSDGFQCTERLTKCKDAVCCIRALDGINVRHGTGFFAKLDIKGVEMKCIVTNNHVLPTEETARNGNATFYYEGSATGLDIKLEPDKLFYTHQILDYSLIGCDSDTIETSLCITPLEFVNIQGNIDDEVFIFQHPYGESKKVSYQKITDIQPPFVFYKADTDDGSSGSPVFKKFQLLALHSKGCLQKYNKGTLFSEIINHLNYGILLGEHGSRKKSRRENHNPQCEISGEKDLRLEPSEKELQNLAKDLINDWKSLGRELDVPNKDILKIHKDNINYDDIVEKAFAMLLKWKELKGNEANFEILKSALINIGLVATAEKHC